MNARWFLLVALWVVPLMVIGCPTATPGDDDDAADDDAADDDAGDDDDSVQCEYGTIYPGVPLIDPDNPVYSDSEWTQSEVEETFAIAKANGDDAYLAYLAAYHVGDLLECAFCSCGCASIDDHESSVDCFKDMHGFT